ncbi:MAG: methylated-DNA--[protein]-cysteine S-methyltransferase [Baekduia sp.]
MTADLPMPAPATDEHLSALRSRVSGAAFDAGLADVSVETHESPFGPIVLGATEAGIVRVALPTEPEERVLEELALRVSPRVLRVARPALVETRRALDRYFGGAPEPFELPLDWQLVRGFRSEVLHELREVGYGQTVSYAELAARAGRPAAVRATGTAMATNPLPILVPCHRVLRTGGAIGGYGGGVEMKRGLLALESGAASGV